MASDTMRGAIERHFGVRLAFQNCHRAAVFRPEATTIHADFITAVTDSEPEPHAGQLLVRRTGSSLAELERDAS